MTDILILPPADTDGPEETGDPVTDGAVHTEADWPAEIEEEHFTSAVDALRIDRNDLFLYADVKITGSEYTLSYYMPGDGLSSPCDDREAIRREVELCDAVVARILAKMPEGLTAHQKCAYFAFVLAAGTEYDHREDYPLFDYPAHAALVWGTAVCSGYAQAFTRLCREAGISCWYCRGTVRGPLGGRPPCMGHAGHRGRSHLCGSDLV